MLNRSTTRVLALLCVMYFITYVDRVNVSTAAIVFGKEFALSNTQVDFVFSAGRSSRPGQYPPGCHFHPRCKYAQAICREKSPVQEEIAPNHFVSCHRAAELSLRGVASMVQA